MMMNGILCLFHAYFITFLFQPGISGDTGKDTLRIKTEGPGNHIKINSVWFSHSPADTVIISGTSGEINQRGINNQVEIKTGGESSNNKKQITNNNQKANNKNQTKPAIRRQADGQATSNEHPVTSNAQPEICNVQPVTCNLKRATCNLKSATCNMLKRGVYPDGKNPDTSGQPVGAKRKSRFLGESCNMLERSVNPEVSGQHVTISQSGNNNSVKINQR